MAEYTLKIDGMHCGACVRRVTQALSALDGVSVNEVTVAPVEAAVSALGKIGFSAKLEA
jgi:copper chaperone CopZ